MTEYALEPTTREHIEIVAANMREADRLEIWATAHHTPLQALTVSASATEYPLTGLADGEPRCIFGIAKSSLLSRDGSPWLLGHEYLPQHAKAFLRMSRAWVEEERMLYRNLVNYVDARNDQSIRWIKWLGFELEEAKPYGVDKIPFHKFTWTRPEEETDV